MLKKLKVKNYKSLRSQVINFEPFNILIGPNASGKSNILDCLIFISDLVKMGLSEAIKTRGDYDHIVFSRDIEKDIEIRVDFIIDNLPGYYMIVFNQGIVKKEELVYNNEKIIRQETYYNRILKTLAGEKRYQTESALINQLSELILESHKKIREFMINWYLYQIVTSNIRRLQPVKRHRILSEDGFNLAQVLHTLLSEYPELFYKIQDILKQAIPEVETLLSPLTEDEITKTYVAIRETGFKNPFDYHQLSDGTLKLLAYITALYCLPEAKLLCFEEPENFVHPRLLEFLVEILKKSGKQIILSTHSPYFIDHLAPEDLIIVQKERGETKVERIREPEGIKQLLTDISLGELWYSGEFGGTS